MIRLARFSVDEILPKIGRYKPRLNLSGFAVKANSLRLQCFKKNQECVSCHVKGNIFILEMHAPYKSKINCFIDNCEFCALKYNSLIMKDGNPHINLYYQPYNGGLILMTRDHIIPRSRGGADKIWNSQTMCANCNSKKGNLLPEEMLS